jgi:hypothetical protein
MLRFMARSVIHKWISRLLPLDWVFSGNYSKVLRFIYIHSAQWVTCISHVIIFGSVLDGKLVHLKKYIETSVLEQKALLRQMKFKEIKLVLKSASIFKWNNGGKQASLQTPHISHFYHPTWQQWLRVLLINASCPLLFHIIKNLLYYYCIE